MWVMKQTKSFTYKYDLKGKTPTVGLLDSIIDAVLLKPHPSSNGKFTPITSNIYG